MIFCGMKLDEQQENFVECCKDQKVKIVFCDAAAGSGKTTLAMGAGYVLVKDGRITDARPGRALLAGR